MLNDITLRVRQRYQLLWQDKNGARTGDTVARYLNTLAAGGDYRQSRKVGREQHIDSSAHSSRGESSSSSSLRSERKSRRRPSRRPSHRIARAAS